ncbi:hypothetical protein [Microbacterium radiodurans]|uniref:YtxH domain-containing protein n=1 Tax=Microbacterium radiodurans TaxID=661398 RepID=A0A5J5IV12_9MICO|nr:hypothetical protein [Microbacterium radiodurans]KAA9089509.1 hypothetical protein F6B42_03240 [Microbacterium radiodurans]
MKGKIGIAVGLAAGYVLGARAGRQRYEQIKQKAQQVWELDPVQKQVDKVAEFGKSAALAVPSVVWDGAKRVVKAINKGDSAGEKIDNAAAEGKKAADDVRKAAERDARKVADASAAADS